MRVVFFCRIMPDLCGAFLHDIDLAIELQTRGHEVAFLTIQVPKEGFNGGVYRGFRFLHYTAASTLLETSNIWITPHSPILPDVRKINSRNYNRPIVATCHFDGNYNAVRVDNGSTAPEMLFFVNDVMEAAYRKNIVPWPRQIRKTDIVRPILHRNKIYIGDDFTGGDCITLINANQNKGQAVFLDIARKMPDTKFLAVIPYYGNFGIAPSTANVEWIPFDNDIRNVLRRTRILLMPSYYESFGRVAVEAMVNGIPVLYSKPAANPPYPGGSTEGMESWIKPAGIACDRDNTDEWVSAIRRLEDSEVYTETSRESKAHIDAMNLFTEAARIAGLVEQFSRENPVVIRQATSSQKTQQNQPQKSTGSVFAPPQVGGQSAGLGFSNGRLRIQR